MDLSVIIVNWHSKDYLRKCLLSLLNQTPGVSFEVVVIDSASFDGCGEMLCEEFPGVRFVQSEENLGFAGANNQAFAMAQGESILFLNPDTELVGPAVERLYWALQSLADAGAVGARLLNTDGTLQTTCVQAFPTIFNQAVNADVLRRRFPRAGWWGTSALHGEGTDPVAVDAVSGACLMVKRSAFRAAGLFSTDYFMYSEDVDLCYKLHQQGRRNYLVPAAVVVHHGGGSSRQAEISRFASVMLLESRWRFFCKTKSAGYGWLYRVCMLGVSVLRVLVALVLTPLDIPGGSRRWTGALKKWFGRLRWALGLERWAREHRA